MFKSKFRRVLAVLALVVGLGAAGASVSSADAAPAHHAMVVTDWQW